MQLQINFQMVVLLVIMAMLGFGAGWFAYDVLAPISATEFIGGCDYYIGEGEWKVENNTCVPISYLMIPEMYNITLPVRGRH
jgi:hypothetical protein